MQRPEPIRLHRTVANPPGTPVKLLHELRDAQSRFSHLTFYERFEHAVVLVLTALIVVIVASATWHLALAVLALVLADQVDPAKQQMFQAVFGMIFTVIIALEFKHSLLVVLARQESVVRVRSVVLIALLAVARKFIILNLKQDGPAQLLALAAAVLALGAVYWLVREQDPRATAAQGRLGEGGQVAADEAGR